MSRDPDTGRSHSINIDNSYFERLEEFKQLGTTLTNQSSIHEEIKSRVISGNACYHSEKNLLSSNFHLLHPAVNVYNQADRNNQSHQLNFIVIY
jgi:hypothetical protein